jgi:hypothetical protein
MGQDTTPPLPRGYTLDQGTPPLPSGYTLDTPQGATAPQKKDWLDQAADFASGLWSKVNPKTQAVGAATLAAHPVSTYVTDATQRQALLDQAEKDFKNGDYGKGVARSLYGIIPFLGPQINEAGTDIGTGEVAKGVGESVGLGLNLSTPALVKGATGLGSTVLDAAADARLNAADALTTPKGALKPSVAAAARFGGGAAGAMTGIATGHPVIGALEGYRAGPSLLRAAIGERTPLTPEDIFNSKVAKGVEAAKVREAVRNLTKPLGENAPTSPDFDPESDVIHVPEPNAPAPGETPGSMYSVPRSEVAAAARAGKAGAADVLKSQGKTIIYVPKGAGYGGARVPAAEAVPDTPIEVPTP